MKFLKRFLRSKAAPKPAVKTHEQAILIYFEGEDLDGSIPLQEELYALLESSDIGMFDGNEVGGGELVLFLYGPDSEVLFRFIEPTLHASDFCKGAKAVIRWGGPGSPQREVML